MIHRVSLPELPTEPEREVDQRFAIFVRSLRGDWKLEDGLTASRVVDGIEQRLALSGDSIHVTASPMISKGASVACGFVGLINATVCLYVGHEVLELTGTLGAMLTASTCLVTFVGTWTLLFLWPRRRQVEQALASLDDEVKNRLGTTRGIVTRT